MRRHIAAYLCHLAARMGLDGWVFEIQAEPCGKDNLAEIDAIYGQRFAKVYLAKDWEKLDSIAMRDTLVHELIHAHLAPLTELCHDLLDTAAQHKKESKMAKSALYYMEERTVDQIAVAWARTLPVMEISDEA